MNRVLVTAVAFLCAAGSALAQSGASGPSASAVNDAKPPAATPTFQAVDVHQSPHAKLQRVINTGWLRGDRFSFRQATMTQMIAYAYGVDPIHVVGGPTWLDMNRYDLQAKVASGSQPATLKLMMRDVLKDRFGLAMHEGTALMPVYVLRVANGSGKLKPPSADSNSGCSIRADSPTAPGAPPMAVLSCHNQTTEEFANMLARFQGSGYLNKPIVDKTDRKGRFDFEVKYTQQGFVAATGADAVTLFDALKNQLGLTLTQETSPQPVIMVDSVNETPTANVAGIEKLLPPLPAAHFEVATIKPSKPGSRQMLNIQGPLMNAQGVSLKDLINFSFEVNPLDTEGLIGAPAWLDKNKFDIRGRIASDDDAEVKGKAAPVDYDDLRPMLRELLGDRFKMKSHTETRPVTTYALVAAGPKVKPAADPKARMKCTEGVGPDGKDPRQQFPTRNRLTWCQNMTMAMLGRELQYLANGFIFYPVADKTGLKGGYDFMLNFSSIQLMGNAGGAGLPVGSATSPNAAPSASDPNGSISLFDALKAELGLKLEKEKRPEPVLVIDHIEEQPTEN
jgi:uncharacterized protein (TIGR03435 family)